MPAGRKTIRKLFIANRAEIACRIARTAALLGIRTCGVFTQKDAHTRHVRVLGEVRLLPAGELSANYLNQELLIATALDFQADAVHPGYGFLSENSDFAQKVIEAGLIWVGPRPDAMRKLGGKIEAKEIAREAQVPVAPWARIESDPDAAEIESMIRSVGLPLLIKAAHGGGGRGQRIVRDASDFSEALLRARSEALRSFGSGEVLVEKFLERPRHIEVQVIGDDFGKVRILGERDCTLQRRNQKVIEETPATVLDEQTRRSILDSGKRLAEKVRYNNAGTIEFLAEKNGGNWQFFFMEMNTRLQVEHPVTEVTWGVDLVELQMKVAEGWSLDEMAIPSQSGGRHAIEARLCAEDPANSFLPTPGPIVEFTHPSQPDLRLDAGFESGDVVAGEYDSLFAKMIVVADTREHAISAMLAALDQTLIAGLITNKFFLRALLDHRDFRQNRLFTRWIDQHPELSGDVTSLDADLLYWGRILSSQLFVQREPSKKIPLLEEPEVPRYLKDFHPDAAKHGSLTAHGLRQFSGVFETNGGEVYASGWINRHELCVTFDRAIAGVAQRRISFTSQFEVEDIVSHHGPIVAQVPGVVLDVRATVDQIVEPQQPILVLEAMKIEMPMVLPVSAKITGIHVKQGDRVQPGQTLVTWEPAA